MLTRGLILGVVCLAGGLPASAADLTKVERSIGKQPQYKSKLQRYCLLTFGPRADYRVWLVLDGDTLYVDRNGNSDLTEPGEYTKPREDNSDPASFKTITIFHPDGKTEEKLDFSLYDWFDYKKDNVNARFSPSVSVWWMGRWFGSWGDEEGDCVWGTRPQDAAVLHVAGPLQMGFEVAAAHALTSRGEGEYELHVGVGTKGLGKGSFMHLSYFNNAIPERVYPTAILEFPNRTPGGPPVRVETKLKQRC